MTSPALSPRCGSTLGTVASGTICFPCLGRRLLEQSEGEMEDTRTATAVHATAPVAATIAVPDRLGAHEVRDELGRVVALEIIRYGERATASEESHFRREAPAAARRRLPALVTICNVGRPGARAPRPSS